MESVDRQLAAGYMVLLSNLGYSAAGGDAILQPCRTIPLPCRTLQLHGTFHDLRQGPAINDNSDALCR